MANGAPLAGSHARRSHGALAPVFFLSLNPTRNLGQCRIVFRYVPAQPVSTWFFTMGNFRCQMAQAVRHLRQAPSIESMVLGDF
jgi:hypothetical protein